MRNTTPLLFAALMLSMSACSDNTAPAEQACECPPQQSEMAQADVFGGQPIMIEARECFDCPPATECDNCMEVPCEDCPPVVSDVVSDTHACGANCHCLRPEAIAMSDGDGQPCKCTSQAFTMTYAHLLA